MKNSKLQPWPWTLKMIERLRVGLSLFRILTSNLNIEGDQMALNGLDKVFRISALILNVEDDKPSSTHLSCLVLSCLVFSRCFTWTSIISSSAMIVANWLEVIISSQISSSWPFRPARMSNELPYSAKLNQNLVSQCALLPVTRSVCALCFYPELLVHLIYDHEPTLRLRAVQSVPCALLLGSSMRPSNDSQTSVRPSIQPSDRSLSFTC